MLPRVPLLRDASTKKIQNSEYEVVEVKSPFRPSVYLLIRIPVMATWDDHDYASNNQGNDYNCLK